MKKASTVERYGRWYVGRGQNKGASNIFSLFRQTEVGLSRPSEKCRITGKAPERQIGGFSRLPDSEFQECSLPRYHLFQSSRSVGKQLVWNPPQIKNHAEKLHQGLKNDNDHGRVPSTRQGNRQREDHKRVARSKAEGKRSASR